MNEEVGWAGGKLGRTQAMLGGSMPTLPDRNSISREALDTSALTIYRHRDSHTFT